MLGGKPFVSGFASFCWVLIPLPHHLVHSTRSIDGQRRLRYRSPTISDDQSMLLQRRGDLLYCDCDANAVVVAISGHVLVFDDAIYGQPPNTKITVGTSTDVYVTTAMTMSVR
jgi:hypothetical protein